MREPYAVDFIADCGADPTGEADCAPALQTAVDLALAKKDSPAYAADNSFTLHVPPGVYKFTTSIGVQNMIGITTFRIEGHRAASIFLIACGDTGQAVAGFANQLICEIDGITFLGNGTTSAADCAGLLDINSSFQTVISNCLQHSLVSLYYGILSEGFGAVRFTNCFSANSACGAANGGMWAADGSRSVTFEECSFVDPANINGIPGPSGGANRLGSHINTICVRGAARYVYMRGLIVDEGCITGIRIGDGTNQIGEVDIRGLLCNTPVFPAGNAGIHVQKARAVTVSTMESVTFAHVPFVKLENVDRADLRNMRWNSGDEMVITADADCGYLRVADPIGFDAADIDADVAIPTKFIDVLGTETAL
jgi:hypothetical protein